MVNMSVAPRGTYDRWDQKMGFGQYAESTIREVLETDPRYLLWLYDSDIIVISDEIMESLVDACTPSRDGDFYGDWLGEPPY